MNQSRRGSLYEALINTSIGFLINFFANLLIFPLFGLHISPHANLLMGLIYTAISVARSYVIRRWFNHLIVRAADRFAGSA